jgi:hypothetical protein
MFGAGWLNRSLGIRGLAFRLAYIYILIGTDLMMTFMSLKPCTVYQCIVSKYRFWSFLYWVTDKSCLQTPDEISSWSLFWGVLGN